MADAKITDLAATTSLADTDEIEVASSGTSKKITGANLRADLVGSLSSVYQPLDSDLTAFAGLNIAADKLPYGTGSHTLGLTDLTAAGRALIDDADAATQRTTLGVAANDGWVDDTAATWTYASPSTFTVSGDQTAKFKKATLLKLTQTTVKYFVVESSSYSAPNTTVTIAVNLDYVLANAAISANYYSYDANPQGWPGWFHYTSTLTGWASTPSVTAKFAVCGMVCYVRIGVGSGGYSGTTVTFTLPIVSHATVGNTYHPFRGVNNSSTLTTPASAQPRSNSNVCDVYKDFSDAAWTASGNRSLYGNVWYPL